MSRIQKPDIPPCHLVSYFCLFDKNARKILLVDHQNALLWLPSGGHVEKNEHPCATVIRGCLEELSIQADFWCDTPFVYNFPQTTGLTAGHTHISLWYVLKGNAQTCHKFDEREFHAVEWFHFDEIPYERSDPHLQRFISKLGGYL